jgi:hypothetical protein
MNELDNLDGAFSKAASFYYEPCQNRILMNCIKFANIMLFLLLEEKYLKNRLEYMSVFGKGTVIKK